MRRSHVPTLCLLMLAALACGDPPVPAPVSAPPTALPSPAAEAPPPFDVPLSPSHPVVLWTFDDDRVAAGFASAAHALGATAVQSRDGDGLPALRASGFDWYEDHAAGKGTLGLRNVDAEPAWERLFAARTELWPALDARSRPRCLRDPQWIAEMTRLTTAAATRAAPREGNAAGRALWISLEDEPGMVVRANPGDWCLCERCVLAFRAALRSQYADDLAALNSVWATDYATWDDVRPFTTAAIRAREFSKDETAWNLAPWMAAREFQDRSFADVVRTLSDAARAVAPGVPVGLTGTQAPSAFGGFDYELLLPGISFAEPYDIGHAMAICRDLRPRGVFRLAQTVFPSADPRVARLRMWRGIARGANATILWSSREALRRDGDELGVTPFGAGLTKDFAHLAANGGIGARLALAKPHDEGIVILLSQESIRVRWMLDSQVDGNTWPRRFGSYEATMSTAIASRERAWNALAQRGARFVTPQWLTRAGTNAVAAPRVVVLPDAIALSAATASDLARLAEGGTVLVADVQPGTFDEAGRARSLPRPTVKLSPRFRDLTTRVADTVGPPVLSVAATRGDGGVAPDVEVAIYDDGGRRYAVCVPRWNLATADDGSATGEIPTTNLTLTFTFGDGVSRAVVNELGKTSAAPAATWTVTLDAAEPSVWSW